MDQMYIDVLHISKNICLGKWKYWQVLAKTEILEPVVRFFFNFFTT
jgi:hypothetical protein